MKVATSSLKDTMYSGPNKNSHNTSNVQYEMEQFIFETLMFETVMFETVMFIIIMLARVDCFKNTQLEQLGWEPHGIVHITTKLAWKPWRRALYMHQQRVEKYTVL